LAPEDIRELFSAFGNVTVRRLFGGAGIFLDGTMFALVHDGIIYLKVDPQSADAFNRQNLAAFGYTTRDGKRELMSYRRMPDRLYDDPEELVDWARAALAAAQRKGRAKRPREGRKTGNGRRRSPG
jgi:DNA transformation protein